MKVTIHKQNHPVINIGPLTLSTLDFEINALYQRLLVLRERKSMLEQKLKSNNQLMKETEKELYEKQKLKEKIGRSKYS